MDIIGAHLAQQSYFRDLPPAALQQVARLSTIRRLQRGEVLALEGDPCTAVYFVVEGRIRALKTSAQGRELVVTESGPGEAFYVVPAIDGSPLPATTQAATRATLLAIQRDDFLELLRQFPDVTMRVLQDLARRLRRLNSLVEELSLRSVPQRLARLLLERASAGPAEREQRLTQREMATQLGTVREVVARSLAQFEEQGWIRTRRGVIELLDRQALEQLRQS